MKADETIIVIILFRALSTILFTFQLFIILIFFHISSLMFEICMQKMQALILSTIPITYTQLYKTNFLLNTIHIHSLKPLTLYLFFLGPKSLTLKICNMHAENVGANTKYNPNYIHTTTQNEFLIKYHSHSFSETINIIFICYYA